MESKGCKRFATTEAEIEENEEIECRYRTLLMVAGDFYMIIIISKDERMNSLVNILLLKHIRMYTSDTDVCVLCKRHASP
jgi:hypothetical protein